MTDTADETAAPKTATKKKTAKKKTTAKKTATKKVAKKATKKTAKKATKKASSAGRLRVKQIKSTIHRQKMFKRTLTALGIRHHQGEAVVNDTPAIRGMLNQVRAFVRVTPEES